MPVLHYHCVCQRWVLCIVNGGDTRLMAMTHMQLLSLNICCATKIARLLSLHFMSHVRYLSGNEVRENDKHRYGYRV